ncbi:MAG TPA: hypothetical protein VK988_20980, partial [Acidimicrobiales bacterium]|nr:hypothetical protein [Acidimicrobiales bacterium]
MRWPGPPPTPEPEDDRAQSACGQRRPCDEPEDGAVRPDARWLSGPLAGGVAHGVGNGAGVEPGQAHDHHVGAMVDGKPE